MNVTYEIDRRESSSKVDDVIKKIRHELGDKAKISGNKIEVNSFDEDKLVDILVDSRIKFSKL